MPKSKLPLGDLGKHFEFSQWALNPFNPFPLKVSSDLRELHKWSLAFREEQLLHLLNTSYATALRITFLYSASHISASHALENLRQPYW